MLGTDLGFYNDRPALGVREDVRTERNSKFLVTVRSISNMDEQQSPLKPKLQPI